MRLASLLPMLLLWLGSLHAQPNCHIFDLTATAVQLDPVTCQYFVQLNFQHENTTNQYTVQGNGNQYGIFPYSQVPLLLGPFTASSNGPTVREFVVRDAVFQDCFDEIELEIPSCGTTSLCNISNLEVEAGNCDPVTQTYKLALNFQVQGAANPFFDVWSANQHIGQFALADLPIQIPNFPASGNPKDVVKVCINDQLDCCASLEFESPCANTTACQIIELTVQTGDCTSDSTYKAVVDFGVLGTAAPDTFVLWSNGQFVGKFGMSQLPLTQEFHWDGGTHDGVKVCVFTSVTECCATKEYPVPACLLTPPCAIEGLEVSADTCTSDSTFHAIVKFGVHDPSAVDSFALWVNGQSWGHYGMNQLPLHIENFPWNGLIFQSVKICTGNDPACCKEYQFLAPDCLPFGPCEITDIFLQTGDCTSDSTYKVRLNFNATNPGNGTFTVSIHNQLIDTFNLSAVPLMLELPWNGQSTDFLTVCILGADSTAGTAGCCRIKQFHTPQCLFPCSITEVEIDPGDCNPDANTYTLNIGFKAVNPGNDFFDLWGNGSFLGTFPLANLPLTIPDFPGNGGAIDVIKICINDHPDCCKSIEFQGPNCNHPCEIFDLTLDVGDCTSDSTYKVKLNFHTTDPGNGQFTFSLHNLPPDTFNLSDLPLTLELPSNGQNFDFFTVCIVGANITPGAAGCCRTKEFETPDCLGGGNCEIFDVSLDPGDCDPAANTYKLHLDFEAVNPGNALFEVWGNGTYLGVFALADLPINIPNFPGNGTAIDVIKICINDHPNCCKTLEFQGPNCNHPCEIFDLTVETGDCHPADSTYTAWIDFQVQNPGSNTFGLWANGHFLGNFNLSQLPLQIEDFPWDGQGPNDVVKVCITSNAGSLSCCRTLEFPIPDCFSTGDCEVHSLHAEVGDCTSDSTYQVWVNFSVSNPPSNNFGLWANGQFFGTFNVNQLPLAIPNFPWNGGTHDGIKVCFGNSPASQGDCCAVIEFEVPDCLGGGICEIYNLMVDPGGCDPATGGYALWLDFDVENPGNNLFDVWVNNTYIGAFPLSSLPITLPSVPSNGTAIDVVKVCINDHPDCCRAKEFQGPDCGGSNCEIYNLVVDPGGCDSTTGGYALWLDFDVENPGNNLFDVWVNNTYIGAFPLSSLPITLPSVPSNGTAIDVVKVCINDHPDCCRVKEFQGPDCSGGNCEIYDLVVDPGGCNPATGGYPLWLDFEVDNPGNNLFDVWVNGTYIGAFPLSSLPITLPNVPSNGAAIDVVKVCINDHPDCCRAKEFQGPDCGGGDCEIFDLVVDTGDCTGDSTYQVKINFQVANPLGNSFRLWVNGQVFGDFLLSQLPLAIPNFPWNGGANDFIKVCILSNTPNTTPCCREKEFAVPDCLGDDPCKIYDLAVVRTPCLCGQFFAILTFQHQGGGSGGFDIMGNGNNYGNWPYNTPQPIVLGPLNGDGTTEYEFVVKDHEHPDACHDAVELGKVECMIPTHSPADESAKLTLSPNPTANWLNVTALLASGKAIGQANAEVYAADGRLVLASTIANGANFQLDVSGLPSGIYRLSLLTDSGKLEGTFAKD